MLVLDRGALGSGGTGKSSGIVRCHYGIRSLAAMAWHALPILEGAPEILGAESGYRRTGYLVGVGPQNIGSLRANVAMHRSIGIDVELVGLDAAQEMWPTADLRDFAEFAYEPRGGYGDGHQTALAFAVAARRGGARLRQNSGVAALETRGDRVTGVRLQSGERIVAGEIVLAAGPWSVGLAAPVGVDLPIRSQRAQILLVDPGQPIENLPVFSDLAALQYVRMEGTSSILVGDSDHSAPEWSDPDGYRERAGDEELTQMIPKFEQRFPGLNGARLVVVVCGLLRRHPGLQPDDLPLAARGVVALRRIFRPWLQDLAVGRRAHGRSHHGRDKPSPRCRPSRFPVGSVRHR